jgi:glycerol uptake facilitator-like aquaporin
MGYITQFLSQTKNLWIEAFGTFLLVLVSTSALVTINLSGQATSAAVILVGVLAYAFIYGWLIFAFDGWQKGYFNPAVTFLCWLRGQITLTWLAAAILVQLAGGLLASILVALLFGPMAVDVGLGAVHPMTSMGPVAAVVAEGLGTLFVLVTIIKLNLNDSSSKRGLLVGCSLVIGQLFTMGISGAGLNPIRALAPQLVAADAGNWWIYILGPFVAAIAVWVGANWLHLPQKVTIQQTHNHVDQVGGQIKASQGDNKINKQAILPSEADQSEALQHKAAQALAALRQTDLQPEVSAQPVATAAQSASLQPSFQTDDDEVPPTMTAEASAPQPDKRVPLPKPTAVKFVDFDQPLESSQSHEE